MNPNIKKIYCKKHDTIMPTIHGEREHPGELMCSNLECSSAVIIDNEHKVCTGRKVEE